MDIKKILRESLLENQENRYQVEADFYIYADSLENAKQQAKQWAYNNRTKLDNQAKIKRVILNQFGS